MSKHLPILMLVTIGCSQEKVEKPWFEDVTQQSGVNFLHDTGPKGQYRVPDYWSGYAD